MEKKSVETSYDTVKSGRRLSTRSSPGHELSSRSNGRRLSSHSAKGELPVAGRPKPSHATVRDPQRPVESPFQVSLNLVMKVQPTDDESFEVQPVELCLNDNNFLSKKKKTAAGGRKRSSTISPRAFFGAVEPGYQSDYESGDDSVFLHPKDSDGSSFLNLDPSSQQRQQAVNAQKAIASKSLDATPSGSGGISKALIKKNAEMTGERHKNSLRPFLRSLDGPYHLPRRSNSNISAASSSKSMQSLCSTQSSGSSHRSSKDARKKHNQTTGGRYKNKRSLLRFAALEKPRSKSVGGNPPGFKLYPRPRRLSFNDSAAPPDATINTLNSTLQPQRLNFDECPEAVEKPGAAIMSGSSASSTYSSQSAMLEKYNNMKIRDFFSSINKTHLLNSSVDQSMGPNGETKNVSNAIPGLVASPLPGQSPLPFVAVIPRNVSFQVPAANMSLASLSASVESSASNNPLNSTASFSNVTQQAVACHVDVDQQKGQSFLHQREMRLGFIANGVPMAVNLKLNFCSEGEKLYVEPIELLYEGQKMWRRSARQVIKEIQAQMSADKKKAEALKSANAARQSEKKTPTIKSILKKNSTAESARKRSRSPKEKSPRGKTGAGTSPARYY